MMNFQIGDTYSERFKITADVIEDFAKFSKDYNPLHMNNDFANHHGFARQVSHGVIQLAYISKMIGMNFPGEGALWMGQNIEWLLPVFLGDEITIVLVIQKYSKGTKVLNLLTEIFNQNDIKVMTGNAQVKVTNQLVVTDTISKKKNISSLLVKTQENKLSKNKVALITGASRGIGKTIAQTLASQGYIVVVNYNTNHNEANTTVNEIVKNNGTAVAMCANVSDENSIRELSNKILATWGRCDAIVHCASPAIKRIDAHKISYNDISPYLDTYLKAGINLVNYLSPLMIENKFGRIIFMGTSALYGTPPADMSLYLIAKEALWGYTKCLSLTLARHGITTNMISPSLTITDLTSDIPMRIKEIESIRNPTRRLVTTQDIAYQVANLCSPHSGYMNGINIPITATPI